jgi:hypothetical protein
VIAVVILLIIVMDDLIRIVARQDVLRSFVEANKLRVSGL